ncbi:MAG: phosphoribosylglycinamide formyltransferase [Betaproteobacteria bacterium]|nr:phosphoribosylglycinamide formyltransferase [Betaproteobacteria bacterium]MDE2622275.1 phosphoribosylglycinamide formyltransferase [Betaproteobacteria bacterium]
MRPRIVIMISGRGSNMAALLAANLPLEVAAVISNRPGVAGLALAAAEGVATEVVDHQAHATREAFDQCLAETIDRYQPQLVVLAGFMRILTPAFIRRYQGRLLNIHPSLLPAFPGLNTHRRALEAGVRIHGCTVHFVTEQLDHGPIVAQAAVPVLPDDSEATLAARVLACEHRIYPEVLCWWAEGRLALQDGGRVRIQGAAFPDGSLLVPGITA